MLAAALLFGLFGLSASADAQTADPPIVVHVDGEPLVLDIAPNLQEGTTLVQMRPIFEALGMELAWNPGARTITAVKEGYLLTMTLDSDQADLNGQHVQLARPAVSINGHTVVPLRFVSETTGAFVHWNSVGREILVMTDAYMATTGMTREELQAFVNELQQEIDEEHARELAEQARAAEEEADHEPDSPPLGKVDASKLQGMFYGFEDDFGGYECGGMCWKFYTFLPGNQVVVGEPAGGGPETIDCKLDACRTYSIRDGKLNLEGGESLSIGQTEQGMIVINDAYMSKVAPVADSFTLEGEYVAMGYQGLVGITPFASSWKRYLTFRADGTFESDSSAIGILDTIDTHTSGSNASDTVTGTYAIKKNTLTLRYADGTVTTHVFIPDDKQGAIYHDLQIGDLSYSLVEE